MKNGIKMKVSNMRGYLGFGGEELLVSQYSIAGASLKVPLTNAFDLVVLSAKNTLKVA